MRDQGLTQAVPARAIGTVVIAAILIGVAAPSARADADDDIFAWRSWKSLDAAIALRPLDGPDDIDEKIEIVQDRLDALGRERARLEKDRQTAEQALDALRARRNVLRELSDIRTGGDARTRQTLKELTDQIAREEERQRMRRESIDGLVGESARVAGIVADYRGKAATLRQQESAP